MNLNDSVSHYSRQSEDFSGKTGQANGPPGGLGGTYSISNAGQNLIDSMSRVKNGASTNAIPKFDKPVKATKKFPNLKQFPGGPLDGGSSISKQMNSVSEHDENLPSPSSVS